MQHYQLTVTANARPETAERLLRIIRHRGFSVQNMALTTQDNIITLQLVLHSERALPLLINQLQKTTDVLSVGQ